MMEFSTMEKSLSAKINQDKVLKQMVYSFNKNPSLAKVNKIADRLGVVLSDQISEALTGIELSVDDLGLFARECLAPVYRKCQNSVLSVSNKAQMDGMRDVGININTSRKKPSASRIEHIIERFEKAESFEEVEFLCGKGVTTNIMRSTVLDSIKENAAQLEKAGFKTIMTRGSSSGCCDWCDEMAGAYPIGYAPDGFWRCHKDCTCEWTYKCSISGIHRKITYETNKGTRTKKEEDIS